MATAPSAMSLPPQPLPAAADSPASVTDLVFYATHELAADGVDARLFKHYSATLRFKVQDESGSDIYTKVSE